MASLAELSELVGFFSYSREDDEGSHGALSKLRNRIQQELAAQLGRSRSEFRVWQDTSAIPYGKYWEKEIKTAIGQSLFFIPIVTPRAIRSKYCKLEFQSFLTREKELGRDDLVFPILYISVPDFISEQPEMNEALQIIRARQYADWTNIRQEDIASPLVGKRIERFCGDITKALLKSMTMPRKREADNIQDFIELSSARKERQHKEAPALNDDKKRVLVHMFKAGRRQEIAAIGTALGMERFVLRYHLDRLFDSGLARGAGFDYVTGHVFWDLTPEGRRRVVEDKPV